MSNRVFETDDWWDSDGMLIGLHTLMDPMRGDYFLKAFGQAGDVEGRLLDIGSGAGFLTRQLAQAGVDAIGIDASRGAVTSASVAVESALFVVGDGAKLPFGNGAFEFVVCSEVLEHVADPERVIQEAARVLGPGGVLAFSTPNRTRLSNLVLVWLAQTWRPTRLLPEIHEFERFIRPAELREILARYGLRTEEVVGVSVAASGVIPALRALLNLKRQRISYGEAGEKVRLRSGGSRAVAYMGYAVKV